MKFSFVCNKKTLIMSGIMTVIAAILVIWSRSPLPMIFGFGVVYFLLRGLDIRLSEETPFWWKKLTDSGIGKKLAFPGRMTVTHKNLISWIWSIFLFFIGPWFSVWCMQWTILEPELYAKTGKTAFRLNVLCVLILYLALLVIFARVKTAWTISHILILVIAFADYFVYEFRENEISFADMDTIGTGLTVAKNYRFQLHFRGAVVILLSILAITAVRKFKFKFRHPWLLRIAALALVVWMVPLSWKKIKGRVTQTWEKKGTYRNGFIVNFILTIRDSRVEQPAGYSPEAIAMLEKQYGGGEAGTGDDASAASKVQNKEDKPVTIITIMNESFADFRLIGNLHTNVEATPFIDSLHENTIRGFAMTSVYGAKTPNSEWEYLTSHTMAFMPGGSVVYQQFIDDAPFSMVTTLKNLGYTAVAMHPYYQAGWRRNTVYPKMGFDEMMFMDTGDFDETKIVRDYITDQELFDKIIDRYEAKGEDEPLFVMGVTMQNHGGYKDFYENFSHDVYQVGGEYFTDASQYLSLIHKTDEAVKNLITYFSNVDDPVEIVFFGDHYPSLQAGFIRSLNGKGTSGLTLSELEELFSVPFFIWTNYESDEEFHERISLNYLGTMALERAGVPLPPYNCFIKDMMKVIPAMNIRGYYSDIAGKYLHISDAVGEERTWLQKYRYLQYNAIFDEKGRSEIFFPKPEKGKSG